MTATTAMERDGRCDWCGGITAEPGSDGCDCRPCLACGGPLEDWEDAIHTECDPDVPDPFTSWEPVRRIVDVAVKGDVL